MANASCSRTDDRASLTRRTVLGLGVVALAPALAGCTAPFGASERGVFVIALDDGEVRRVAAGTPWVAWSGDSQQLALRYDDGTIQVANADGSGAQPYAGGTFLGPGWSPAGPELAVIDAEHDTIRIEHAAGTVIGESALREDLPPLWTVATAAENVPVWSPDGTTIAFLAWDGHGDALYTITPAGTGRQKLADQRVSRNRVDRYDWLGQRVATGDIGAPAWSPNGRFLAYAVYPEVRGATGGIAIVAAAGGWPSRVTDQTPTSGPAWSPEGRRIAFTARQDGVGALYVASSSGTNIRNLTGALSLNARDPAWTPDGLEIAFAAGGDLFVTTTDGVSQRIASTGLVTHDPLWSPDGTKIAFLGIPAQPGR